MKFELISGQDFEKKGDILWSMYKLRYDVFIKKLQWPHAAEGPIRSVSGMEIDQFDTPQAYYIVHRNGEGSVDACARLLPTSGAYLLGDIFPELIENIDIPRSSHIWEITRFAVSSKAPKGTSGFLIAAIIEFGLHFNIKNMVSLTNIKMEKIIDSTGWTRHRLGKTIDTGTEVSSGEIYNINAEELKTVMRAICCNAPILHGLEGIHKPFLEEVA
jgi:acyl homoserine lactone synthase